MRSVPLRQAGSVMIARKPALTTASAMRWSSVATASSSMPSARAARSATRTTIGAPPMSARGFPGNRWAAKRAGMIAARRTTRCSRVARGCATLPSMSVIDDIRRAAFELRRSDPQEAVRVLRRAAAEGGEAEVLARGALGEIYLEEFGDLDGAAAEFRKVLKAAPGLAAAEIGLARARREAGSVEEAEAGFTRAVEGLARDLRGFREAKELPPGVEE